MGARLFTALIPPREVVADLDAFCAPRREAELRLRWTPSNTWHLTTAFLPDVSPRSLDRLISLLAADASTIGPLHLRLAGGGCYPEPRRAKLLFAGVTGDVDDLAALAQHTRSAAVRAGTTVDGARFRAHLTLGRSNRGLDATRLIRVLDAYSSPTWWASEHVLIESHRNDRGNRYEVLARFDLAGGRDAQTTSSQSHLG